MSQPAATVPVITMLTAADDLGISRCRLFKLLREHDHFIDTLPRQSLIKQGLFRVEIHQYHNPNNTRLTRQYGITMVTAAGLAWLKEFLHDTGHLPPTAEHRRRNFRPAKKPMAGGASSSATRVASAD